MNNIHKEPMATGSENNEPYRILLVVLTKDAAKLLAEKRSELSRGRFKIPEIDGVLDKYSCIRIRPRFSEQLPIPEKIQEEFGVKRMFVLLFGEDTSIEDLVRELQDTPYIEYAAQPPLRYAMLDSVQNA